MKTLITILILSVVRPPATDPNTIPFPVDPNQGELIGWRQGIVDAPLMFDFQVGIASDDPNFVLNVTVNAGALSAFDPNNRTVSGGDVIDRYILTYIRGVPITEYIRITVTAPAYGTSDSRTVAFDFLPKPSPVIFVWQVLGLDPNYDYALARTEVPDPVVPVNWWFVGELPHIVQGNGGYSDAVKVSQAWQLANGLPIHYGNLLELMP